VKSIYSRKDVTDAVFGILEGGYKKFTVFFGDDKKIPVGKVTATRRGKVDKRATSIEIILTIGRLNYEEKERSKVKLRNGESTLDPMIKRYKNG